MKVEIKLTRDEVDTQENAREALRKLNETYFPLAIIRADSNKGLERSASWSGSLEDFLKYLELRKSFDNKLDASYYKAVGELMVKSTGDI